MRKLTLIVSMAASLLLSALPALAAEDAVDQANETQQKDECLLMAKNCTDDYYSLQLRIDRLKGEICKGTDVYTSDELQILKKKLNETYLELNDLSRVDYR